MRRSHPQHRKKRPVRGGGGDEDPEGPGRAGGRNPPGGELEICHWRRYGYCAKAVSNRKWGSDKGPLGPGRGPGPGLLSMSPHGSSEIGGSGEEGRVLDGEGMGGCGGGRLM